MKIVVEVGMNDGTDTVRYLDCSDMVLYGLEPDHLQREANIHFKRAL